MCLLPHLASMVPLAMWALKVLQGHYSTIATQCSQNNHTKPENTPALETTSGAARSLRKTGSAPSAGCNRLASQCKPTKQTQRKYWKQPSSHLPVMQTKYLQHPCESPTLSNRSFLTCSAHLVALQIRLLCSSCASPRHLSC